MKSLSTTFVFCVVIACSVATRVVIAQDPSAATVRDLIERIGSSDQDQATIARALGIGNVLLQVGRYDEATELFKALAKKQPENPIVIYSYALATFNSGKPADAESLAQRAVALANSLNDSERPRRTADALVLLAVISAVQKNDAMALKSLQQAVALKPDHFDAQLSLGRLLFGMGDNAGAIKAFRAAATLQPENPQVLFFLATTLERSGESENALSTYRKLVTLHPKIFEGHLGLGALLLKRGSSDTEEGVKELLRALEINPNLYEARVALGRALIASGNPLAALEHLERAAQLAPDNPEPHYQLSLAYRRLGRKDDAASQAQIVKRIHESRRNSKVPKQTRVG